MAIEPVETKCILCAHSCANPCCWADEQKPVPGWVAEKTRLGYRVIECPEYVKDTYETIKPVKIHDRGADNLIQAIAKQMREDYVHGKGPYDDYNKNRKREARKTPGEIRGMNRQAIEKWLMGPVAAKLLEFSDTEAVIDGLRKMARQYETDLRTLMR